MGIVYRKYKQKGIRTLYRSLMEQKKIIEAIPIDDYTETKYMDIPFNLNNIESLTFHQKRLLITSHNVSVDVFISLCYEVWPSFYDEKKLTPQLLEAVLKV